MTVNECIIKLIEDLGLNQAEFSKKCNINPRVISDIKKPNHGIKADTLRKILITYKNLNARWLLTGEGEMFDTSVMETKEIKPKQYKPIDEKVNLMKEKEPFYMMVQVDYLKNMLAEKERIIKSKEETIETLRNSINK